MWYWYIIGFIGAVLIGVSAGWIVWRRYNVNLFTLLLAPNK